MCDSLTNPTAFQRTTLQKITSDSYRLAKHMRDAFPSEPAWKNLLMGWKGAGSIGTSAMRVDFESDCLVIGVPPGPPADVQLLTTRTILALTQGAAGSSRRCTDLYSKMLEGAADLGIPIKLQCEDVAAYGLVEAKSVPVECSKERVVWPEYSGRHVRDVMKAFEGRPTEIFTVDSMWNRPPSESSGSPVRIVYDPRTGLVKIPPYVSSAPPPEKDPECFFRADPGSRCVGAPLEVPDWKSKYIGSLLPGVLDDLRMTYPHAVIEPIPNTTTVSRDRRADRVRVRFDDAGVVTSLALG